MLCLIEVDSRLLSRSAYKKEYGVKCEVEWVGVGALCKGLNSTGPSNSGVFIVNLCPVLKICENVTAFLQLCRCTYSLQYYSTVAV